MRKTDHNFRYLLLSALVVLFIFNTLIYKSSFSYNSKTWYICQQLINGALFPVSSILSGALLLIVIVMVGIGLLSLAIQLIKTHQLINRVLRKETSPTKELISLFKDLGLDHRVILVEDNSPFSLCAGVIFPRIIISTGLASSLKKQELSAVLIHEQAHLIRRDPLRILVGKTLSSMFFFLPIFREFYKRMAEANELIADQWVIDRQQKNTYLRKALRRILSIPQDPMAAVANVSGPDFLEIRIRRLINPAVEFNNRISSLSLMTTFLFITLSLSLLRIPGGVHNLNTGSESLNILCLSEKSCEKQCHLGTFPYQNYVDYWSYPLQSRCQN